MEKKDVERFEKLHIQIKDMYSELSILSKKSPDGAINKFKLNFINQLIEEANQLLGKRYMPFSDFQRFQEDDMPFNSDVVLIISQYIKCLEKFKYDNVKRLSGNWYWNLSDTDEEVKNITSDNGLSNVGGMIMNKTTQDAVNQYELLNPLLTGIYKEMQELSKKKPDSPLNAFKVKAINRILEPIKEMLKMENTHAFLDVLDVDEMPTNSDVVLVLNQYMNAMKIFYEKYYTYNSKDGHKWRIQS